MVELFLAMEKVACSSHVLRSICDYGLKAMILGFQPSGLGSIPSGRSICEYDGTGIRTCLRSMVLQVQLLLLAPLMLGSSNSRTLLS